MKKLFLIFILLSISNFTFADWEPFPLNQKSYYVYGFGADSMINSVYMDTIVQRNNYQALFFNHKYYGYTYGNCYPTYVNVDQPAFQAGSYGQIEFDSLVLSSDTLFYTLPLANPQYLLLNPSIGQSWPFLNYTLTYSGDSVMQISGVADSVKLFTGLPNDTVILSKNHGYVSYPQFNTTNIVMHKLTGFSDQSGTYGFIKPSFLDFIPYHPGDLLYWVFSQEPIWSTPIFHYRVDSITNVSFGPDSIILTYNSLWYNNDTVIYTSGEQFALADLPNVLEAPTNWIAFSLGFGDYSIFGTTNYIKVSDGSLDYKYVDGGFLADTVFCSLSYILDYGNIYVYNTYQGLTEISSDVFYPISQKLAGSVINGVARGDTLIRVGIDEIDLSNIGVYPNPVSEYLKIKNHSKPEHSYYSIIDVSGRIVQEGKIISETIGIQELTNGIYFLRITNGIKKGSIRFVKQSY